MIIMYTHFHKKEYYIMKLISKTNIAVIASAICMACTMPFLTSCSGDDDKEVEEPEIYTIKVISSGKTLDITHVNLEEEGPIGAHTWLFKKIDELNDTYGGTFTDKETAFAKLEEMKRAFDNIAKDQKEAMESEDLGSGTCEHTLTLYMDGLKKIYHHEEQKITYDSNPRDVFSIEQDGKTVSKVFEDTKLSQAIAESAKEVVATELFTINDVAGSDAALVSSMKVKESSIRIYHAGTKKRYTGDMFLKMSNTDDGNFLATFTFSKEHAQDYIGKFYAVMTFEINYNGATITRDMRLNINLQ